MKSNKKTVKIVGYCSKWEEGIGWVVNIPLDELVAVVEQEGLLIKEV